MIQSYCRVGEDVISILLLLGSAVYSPEMSGEAGAGIRTCGF